MLTETEAIEIATKFVDENKISCQFPRAIPPNEKSPIWQIVFSLILPENVTVDPNIVVVEVDVDGNASFFPII